MKDATFVAITHPCPKCASRRTRVYGVNLDDGTREVCIRHCLTCGWRWDYLPEFAPRRRKKREGT